MCCYETALARQVNYSGGVRNAGLPWLGDVMGRPGLPREGARRGAVVLAWTHFPLNLFYKRANADATSISVPLVDP